jgi:hypothetical protein
MEPEGVGPSARRFQRPRAAPSRPRQEKRPVERTLTDTPHGSYLYGLLVAVVLEW